MGSITETPPFELRVVRELRDVVDRGQELERAGDRVDVALTRAAYRDLAPWCHHLPRSGRLGSSSQGTC